MSRILYIYLYKIRDRVFISIIKYIRKNRNRITIIRIDNGKIDRDYDIYINIMKYYNSKNINFLWVHNDHVADLPYIQNKSHKWGCGHYLKTPKR